MKKIGKKRKRKGRNIFQKNKLRKGKLDKERK